MESRWTPPAICPRVRTNVSRETYSRARPPAGGRALACAILGIVRCLRRRALPLTPLHPRCSRRLRASYLSRCEAAGALGRFPSVSAQSPGRCAPLRPASLRSKLPRRPLLRTSYSTSDGAEYTRPPNSLLSMYRPLASPPNSSILVMRSQAFFSSSPCSFTNQSKNWTVR